MFWVIFGSYNHGTRKKTEVSSGDFLLKRGLEEGLYGLKEVLALSEELQSNDESKCACLGSNQGPQSYQDCALTN